MILFLDNGANHLLYERVARDLAERSVPAGVLYFSPRKYRTAALGPAQKFLLDLRDTSDHVALSEGATVIERVETSQAEFTLAGCIAIDRSLRFAPEKGERVLAAFAGKFHELLVANKVSVVLGELTWGVELVAYYVAADIGVAYGNPLTVAAFSSPRFGFFDARNSVRHIEEMAMARDDMEVPLRRLLRERQATDVNRNTGVYLRRTFTPATLRRAWDYLANGFTGDYRYGLGHKLRYTFPKIWNKWLLRGPYRRIFTESIPTDVKIVLLPLHVQPEATPDTVAWEFSNQLEVARLITMGLPRNAVLLVKEHPNDVGCRSPGDLRRYSALPRTTLISPDWPMGDLLKRASMVVSVAGTVLMEAALEGVPCIALSDVYFTGLSGITRCTNPHDLVERVKQLLGTESVGPRERPLGPEDEVLLKTIFKGTFEGVVHHPRIVPGILEPDNVRKIAAACRCFWEVNGS